MKKGFFFALIVLLFSSYIYCDDIAYVVTQDSHLLLNRTMLTILSKGDVVFFQGRMDISIPVSFTHQEHEVFVRTEQGREGWISEKHILLRDSQPLAASIVERHWIYSFYQKFLIGYEKEVLFDNEPFWRNEWNDFSKTDITLWNEPWWSRVDPTRFVIRNNLVRIVGIYALGSVSFMTINQHQKADSIVLNVLCVRNPNIHPENHLVRRFSEGTIYRLTFRFDGDYMDVFVDDDMESIATLIGVEDNILVAVDNFFRGVEVDLSSITSWPRRADGSMDFPPPDGIAFMATHRTSDRLRVRESPDTASQIITTLNADTEVWVRETGPTETIGGITAPWVMVVSESGYEGWCFSGYLEQIQQTSIVEIIPVSNETTITISEAQAISVIETKNNRNNISLFWVIIGSIILMVGIVFIIKRKKK